eukprot:TRINITY_DN3823_c1_g1_i1.p1 TRINITY_DN3823_c1_g1~~TRINITY_DN3823_c1_g1_i1.p1  ORF type:complete len:724 (-),score=170.10 TRINITY_DN3823_c1_g1_i1:161-2263(-)
MEERTVTSKVELSISCENLINMDTFSKSDPIVILYTLNDIGKWHEYGRTEMIKDNLNPQFVKKFIINYHFEELQKLKFECYDIDAINEPLSKQDFIGEMYCTLAEIVTSSGQKIKRPLTISTNTSSVRGDIIISVEEVQDVNQVLNIQFSAKNLDKVDFFTKSDPFVVISKVREDGQHIPVLKTEIQKKTQDPSWKSNVVSLQLLCNGDFDRPLIWEIFDYSRSGNHTLIGLFQTSMRDLDEKKKREFEVINDKKKSKKSYKNSGKLYIDSYKLTKTFSFLDYIQGGCKINLVVAVDFTASNGNPQLSSSLHYDNPNTPNEYQQAIKEVGTILCEYDTDQMFPCYGFGAKLPPNNQVSHCFPLNGNPNNPEVHGLQGILDSYSRSLKSVVLYGPTIFSQILRTAFSLAEGCTQDNQSYQILLILTDGVIDDMQASIDEIVRGNNLPLSIVIVGIGNADFDKMEVLDADDNPLQSTDGTVQKRDTVQFVPFRQFKNDIKKLTRETLEEIPSQLVGYMSANGLKPNPPTPFDPNQKRIMPQQVSNLPPNFQQYNSNFSNFQPNYYNPNMNHNNTNMNNYQFNPNFPHQQPNFSNTNSGENTKTTNTTNTTTTTNNQNMFVPFNPNIHQGGFNPQGDFVDFQLPNNTNNMNYQFNPNYPPNNQPFNPNYPPPNNQPFNPNYPPPNNQPFNPNYPPPNNQNNNK